MRLEEDVIGIVDLQTSPQNMQEPDHEKDEADEEYQKFVRSLNDMVGDLDDIGEDEAWFHSSNEEEEDDEEDEVESSVGGNTKVSPSQELQSMSDQASLENCFDTDGMLDLERELEMLLEEDFVTALASVDLPMLVVEKTNVNQPQYEQDGSSSSSNSFPSTSMSSPLHKKSFSQSPIKINCESKLQNQAEDRRRTLVQQQSQPQTSINGQGGSAVITHSQIDDLRQLLKTHFQLLIQQAVLATRSASFLQRKRERDRLKVAQIPEKEKQNMFPFHIQQPGHLSAPTSSVPQLEITSENYIGSEAPDELAEILDASVGMLQELDQNRQDAIRKLIQKEVGRNNINFDKESLKSSGQERTDDQQEFLSAITQQRRLTRAAFQQTLQNRNNHDMDHEDSLSLKLSSGEVTDSVVTLATARNNDQVAPDDSCFTVSALQNYNDRRTMSVFDIRGLSHLKEAFAHLDKCSGLVQLKVNQNNILSIPNHGDACESLLRHTGSHINKVLVPGRTKLTELFSNRSEISDTHLSTSLSDEDKLQLMRNRNIFTSSEDNLVLRGVNLFGEKEWVLIVDRLLPDHSQSLVNQRHSSLTLNIFRNNGINIDTDGNLAKPPDYPDGIPLSVKHKMDSLKTVSEPYTHNVHRWSIEEDITLLKAVPIMGRLWAEISNHLIPYRDRGHLRKRYQVLERRVKAVIKRGGKKKVLSTVASTRTTTKTKPKVDAKPSLFLGGGKGEQSKRKGTGRRRADKMDINFPFSMPPPMHMMHGIPYPMPPMRMGIPMGFPQPGQIIHPGMGAKAPSQNTTPTCLEKNIPFNMMPPGVTFNHPPPIPFGGIKVDSINRNQTTKPDSNSSIAKKNSNVMNEVPYESNSCMGFQKLLEVDQDQWSNMSHIGTMSQPSKFEAIEHEGLEGSRILTSLSIDSPGTSLLSVLGESKKVNSEKPKGRELKGADRTKALFQVLAQATNMEESTFISARPQSGTLATPAASPSKRSKQIMTPNSLPQVATVGSFTADNVDFSNIHFSERSRLAFEQSNQAQPTPSSDVTKLKSEDEDFYDSAVLLFSLSSPAKKRVSEASPSPRRRKRSLFGNAVSKPPQDTTTSKKRSLFASAVSSVQEKKDA